MTTALIALAWIILAGLATRLMRRIANGGDPPLRALPLTILLWVLVGLPVALYRWVAGE